MKIISFLAIFALAGLFFMSFSDYSQAGTGGGNIGQCLESCRTDCNHAVFSSLECGSGPGARECRSAQRILNKCCYTDCAGDNCGTPNENENDIPGEESTICEAIERFFEQECPL